MDVFSPKTAIGRKNRLFVGSDRGGMRAAATYSLIETAKLQIGVASQRLSDSNRVSE